MHRRFQRSSPHELFLRQADGVEFLEQLRIAGEECISRCLDLLVLYCVMREWVPRASGDRERRARWVLQHCQRLLTLRNKTLVARILRLRGEVCLDRFVRLRLVAEDG